MKVRKKQGSWFFNTKGSREWVGPFGTRHDAFSVGCAVRDGEVTLADAKRLLAPEPESDEPVGDVSEPESDEPVESELE
jgi:hypothetical protein